METDEEIISCLKFIGKIKKGEKINVKYLYTQTDNIITKLTRTLISQCNRQNCLTFIRNIISKSFELILSYNTSNRESHKFIAKNILEDIKLSKTGILNLKDTYIEDLKFGCDIDTLIQKIDSKIEDINESKI